MQQAKRYLAIAAAVLLGPYTVYYGAVELTHSIELKQRGKTSTATVVSGRDSVSGKSRSRSYYLTVAFRTAAGQSVQKEVKVSEETYNAGRSDESIRVFYLAEAPTVCAAGNVVDVRYGTLLMGLLMIAGGIFLYRTRNTPANLEELAERVEAKLGPLMKPRHDYVPAVASDFKHLDLDYYDSGQRSLEQRGYQLIGDRENMTLKQANGWRTMLRLLLGADMATQAFLYHFKVSTVTGLHSYKIIDLQTSFSNGNFVCTSNARAAGKLDSPTEVSAQHLAEANLETVLETHEKRVRDYLEQNPGVTPVLINSPEQFQQVMDALQSIKANFRRKQGISQAELERISGKTGPQIQELAEILKQRWAEHRPALQKA
jgi:hypothetical protein